jgi:GntR family transcriptional regulator
MKYFPLQKNGPVPLYVQLAEAIRRNIREGILKEGDLIPSESQLMEAYQISRITVRNAQLRLEYEDEVFKVHGRGSFVAKKQLVVIPSPSLTFEEQMRKQGLDVSLHLVEFCDVYPNEGVSSELEIAPGGMVTKLKRTIKVGTESVGLKVLFVPLDIGKSLEGKDLAKISLVDYLNSTTETRIARMEVRVRAAVIENGDAEVMGVDTNNTVIVRGGVYWNYLGRPVMSGKILYLAQHALIKMEINAESASSGVCIDDIAVGALR